MKFELAVEVLIDAGADVNYDGESGDTPLGLAIKRRFPRIEQMLRDAGARQKNFNSRILLRSFFECHNNKDSALISTENYAFLDTRKITLNN